MPIDESKLKDVLKNRPTFRVALTKEIGNYDAQIYNPQFENGLLSYINEASYGEMRDLVRDVGVHPDNLEFFNVGDLAKKREQMFVHPSDHNFNYLMNALFTPLDMTDYENTFVGYNEVSGALPINNGHLLKPVIEEPWPTNHALVAIESVENRPVYSRSKTHKELQDSKNVEEDEEEEEEEEEGEGEGEEEEGGEEEEEEAEEEPAYPPVD